MPPPRDTTSERRRALIVACSEYRDPTLQRLRAPGRDAEALAEVLRDPAIGAFDVRALLNLPSYGLLRGIAEYCADSRPTDLLLTYFSCHGVLDDRGELYYATVDTERRLLGATAVSATWLNDQLKHCRARRQVLILDCCHSGAFAHGMKGGGDLALVGRFGRRGRVVLTASTATEYSFEGDHVLDDGISSVFTAALVQGLRTGDADRDKDGLVTVNELYDHVYERMQTADTPQTPTISADAAEGNILVAHSPRGAVITPVPLPDDLRANLESSRPRFRESAVTELADLLDGAEPGLALTARQRLERVADDDLPRVAALARAALGAELGSAAEQVRSDLEERARRLAEEQSRRVAEERARRKAEEQARREAEDQARREAEEQARRDAEEARRKEAERRARLPGVDEQMPSRLPEAGRALPRRRSILAVAVGVVGLVAVVGVVVLVAFRSEATIMSHLPNDLRPTCTATPHESATCHMSDGTVVFFRLFGTVDAARADAVDGNKTAPDGDPCPPPAPAADTAVTCRYAVGAEKGVATFSYTAKGSHRFYLSRWSPDAEPLRGEMSSADANPQDWATLQANWTRLAGMS